MAQQQRQRKQLVESYRDFDADVDEFDAEGPTFDLGGETFHCVPMPAGGTLARIAAAIGRDERGRQVFNLPDMNAFIEDCLIDEVTTVAAGEATEENPEPADVVVVEPADDIARWQALMADKKRPVPIKKLGELTVWLTNYYSEDRPTRPSGR